MNFLSYPRDWVRLVKRKRRFSSILHETIGQAARWTSVSNVMQIINTQARAIKDARPGDPLMKGTPDLRTIKSDYATNLLDLINRNPDLKGNSDVLEIAARIASVEPRDIEAFKLYLAVFWIVHNDTIMALKLIQSPFIAVHMTCNSRIDRADKSIESFSQIPSSLLMHIKLVGNGGKYNFHPESNLLEVPASDHYESLPAKIFLCYFIIVIACNPRCIIKLDDDHRLADKSPLIKALEAASRCSVPAQYGHLWRILFPSAHNRGWHFGKCSDESFSKAPLEMPAPLAWASGDFGYILNQQALWRLAWASLYYRRWLDIILYEDVAVGEVADKTWIKKVHYRMETAIKPIDLY